MVQMIPPRPLENNHENNQEGVNRFKSFGPKSAKLIKAQTKLNRTLELPNLTVYKHLNLN